MGLSHEFSGNTAVEVAYSGLHGTNLPGTGNRNLNELSSQYYSVGSGLLTKQPCANANNLVMSVGQCDRTYPYYNNVQDSVGYYAIENYRSFQAKAEKRMGAAGVIMTNYTWAQNKANTDTQNGFIESKSVTQGGTGSAPIQDWNNLRGEYSLISFDVTNRLIVAYNLKLPFGKGQKYGNNFSGLCERAGFRLGDQRSNDLPVWFPRIPGGGYLKPNPVELWRGHYPSDDRSGLQSEDRGLRARRGVQGNAWFNTACFENDAVNASVSANGVTQYPIGPGQLGAPVANVVPFTPYMFGNEPRVDPTLRGDGIKNFDFSFQKSTSIRESASLEFRTEFYNVFNRVQFAPPGPTVGSNNFGQVGYQVNKPRQIQLSLRLNY